MKLYNAKVISAVYARASRLAPDKTKSCTLAGGVGTEGTTAAAIAKRWATCGICEMTCLECCPYLPSLAKEFVGNRGVCRIAWANDVDKKVPCSNGASGKVACPLACPTRQRARCGSVVF